MLGLQSAIGSTATPDISIPYTVDGFSIEMDTQVLQDGGNNFYNLEELKTLHRDSFSFSCYARPVLAAQLIAYMLGSVTISGTTDPYTHTITRDERQYLTVERKLYDSLVQRISDCKINTVTLSANAGQPITMNINGVGVSTALRTTELTPSYSTDAPFLFYHGAGRFKYATTADENVRSFSVTFSMIEQAEQIDDEFQLADFPDMGFGVDCTFQIYFNGSDRWKEINYYNTTSQSENLKTAALELDLQYTDSGNTRQLKITIPELLFKPINSVRLSPSVDTYIEDVAGVALKQSTTELVTVTCKNSLSTTII